MSRAADGFANWTLADIEAHNAKVGKRGQKPALPAPSDEPAPKQSKYHNVKVETPEGKFDSKKEYQRWLWLKARQQSGEISNLERQQPFRIGINGVDICAYYCDFMYNERQNDGSWKTIVEDTKSAITRRHPVYSIKKKLMRAVYSVEIRET